MKDKDLKELEKLIDKLIEDFDGKDEENENNLKKGRKKVEEQLEISKVIVFANQNGSMSVGKTDDVLASLSLLINNLLRDVSLNTMAKVVVTAIACKDNSKEIEIDHNKLNEVLEAIKELM